MYHKFIFFLILSFFLLPSGQVLAQNYTIGGAEGNLNEVTKEEVTGISIRELAGENGGFLGVLVKGLLAVTGFIFFLLTIYGGFLWMTARGDDAKVEQGRNVVMQATIGLVIIVAAYAITNFIVGLATRTKPESTAPATTI